jgi:hypothetical protein
MTVPKIDGKEQREESRAGRFISHFNVSVLEGNSIDGLPEFQNYPKVRRKFLQTPMRLKKETASKAHVLALTKAVFDMVGTLSAEISRFKGSLDRP